MTFEEYMKTKFDEDQKEKVPDTLDFLEWVTEPDPDLNKENEDIFNGIKWTNKDA